MVQINCLNCIMKNTNLLNDLMESTISEIYSILNEENFKFQNNLFK